MTIRLDLFCRVIDNYGDIGICWRLARQLHAEHGIAVRLWVDDLVSFRRLRPEVDTAAENQMVQGVAVRHWRDQDGVYTVDDVADIVIEFFAVDLPPSYVAAMAQCTPRPVWFNLEGLTAEEWVEGCHRLTSPHPQLPLTKHFFFPGFTEKTGGLPREAALFDSRRAFLENPATADEFLQSLGATPAELAATRVSLFCYPFAPVAPLFDAWRDGAEAITCFVPEGVATQAVQGFLGTAAIAGAAATQGKLTVRVLPFVPQPDYDQLLWACDVNLVRGEDSWVRAQWAGKPFVWHIYAQDDNLHHKKLRAFLQRYAVGLDAVTAFSLAWNGVHLHADWPALWRGLRAETPQIAARAVAWEQQVAAHGDLTANLLAFAQSIRGA
ncbi:elongation factor P maturation arginine rhamnosyltransferase EarP [Duganella sp. FT27W]|uniref:elongation factor P maturation arginine rhamnosyltransferase EarP n=1 Tax=Duganella sp. FT27W TaxID=2654636 RepID=UPI00128D1DF2|nr:elongation factor P maturation arginine rhamnosyltransferase EarP [Duganella sp. FT27W]MPQ57980.1 elongation factor P maturation arginine rhamnosyltransferase EarP [Duganella sp. FT27W]